MGAKYVFNPLTGNLDTTDVVAFNGEVNLGTAAAPSVFFTGDTNTGIYSPGADQVAISTNGTGRLFVDANGTTRIENTAVNNSPLFKISTFNGYTEINSRRSTGGSYSQLRGTYSGNSTDFWQIGSNGFTDGSFAIWAGAGGAERLRIDSSGRLGLGTSSPSSLLHVQTGTNGSIQIGSDGGSQFASKIFNPVSTIKLESTASDLIFSSARHFRFEDETGSPFGRWASDGRLGIGTTSPTETLTLNGATGSSLGFEYGGSEVATIANDNSALYVEAGSGKLLRLGADGNEAARIDSSGRLLVGTSTAPSLTAGQYAKAHFVGNTFTAAGDFVFNLGRGALASSGLAANTSLGILQFTDSAGAAHATIQGRTDGVTGVDDYPGALWFSTTADGSASPTEAMRINNAGDLLVGYTTDNGAYKLQVNSQIFATSATIATSDGRYKENVDSLNGCLDLVKALRPVSFTWKPQEDITRLDDEGNEVLVREGHNFPEGTQVGFIAQEVQEVLDGKPWLGSIIKENVRPAVKDNDGNELAPEEQFYGFAEGNLIAVLTNALQEAVTEIESLKDRLDAANL